MKHQLNGSTTVETYPDNSVVITQLLSDSTAFVSFTGVEFMDMVRRISELFPKPKIWTVLYPSDAGDQVEIVYCDHEPTIDEIIYEFEHLKNRVGEEGFDADAFIIQEYCGIPTIK